MGILDSTGEKMLLGRQKSWPQGVSRILSALRFLVGFVPIPEVLFDDQACTLV